MQWVATPRFYSSWEHYCLTPTASIFVLSLWENTSHFKSDNKVFLLYVTKFYDQVNLLWYSFTNAVYWMKTWSKGKMLLLSLEPSSRGDHNNKEVYIITHKSAPPNLISLQTCSWMQVLMLIMSHDTSEIKGQWIRRICNKRIILIHAELVGKVPHSSYRLNPSAVPLTQSPIFKSPHFKFFMFTWI